VTHEVNRDLFARPLFFLPLVALLVLAALFLFPRFPEQAVRDRRYAFLVSWLFVSLLPPSSCSRRTGMSIPPWGAVRPAGQLLSVRAPEVRAVGRATRVLVTGLALYFAVFPMAGILLKNDTLRRLHSFQSDLVQETLGQIGKPAADRPTNVFFLNMPNSILVFACSMPLISTRKRSGQGFPVDHRPDIPTVELLDDRSMRITTRAGPF